MPVERRSADHPDHPFRHPTIISRQNPPRVSLLMKKAMPKQGVTADEQELPDPVETMDGEA